MMPLRHCCMVDACHWLQQCVHGDKRAPLLIFYLLWVWFAHSMIWSASFTQMQKHALVANDLVNGEKKMLREEEALSWNTQEDGSTDDEEMSELVKVKRTKGKENNQKENQREIKPNHQIPWVREEANRGGGAAEKIYSWLLLRALIRAQWQNKPLWCFWCSLLPENQHSYTTSTAAINKAGVRETEHRRKRLI